MQSLCLTTALYISEALTPVFFLFAAVSSEWTCIDWPVELLRGLEGWASISESAWHTNQAEFPMGTIEVNFLFWSFLVEE